jgi:large subunit ribosomal protein L25
MAERVVIQARPRDVLGKKVKQLRREGILPANIYGRGLDSRAVQVDAREFQRQIREAGVRSMFQLDVEGETQPRYVLIRGLVRQGGTGPFIHADFYQVDLKRPITTNISLVQVGEAPAVRDLAGTLMQLIENVTVRCLPLDIPGPIEVPISKLTSFDITLTVGDLDVPGNVEIVTDASVPVATVNPPRLRLKSADEEGEEGEGEEGAAEGEEAEEASDGESSDEG